MLIRRRHVPRAWQFTAVFDDYVDGVDDKAVLLDHIAVSDELRDNVCSAGISHDIHARFQLPTTTAVQKFRRDQRTSDHRPVWLDLN